MGRIHRLSSLSLKLQKNAAGEASFSLPYTEALAGELSLARHVSVHRGTELLFSGRIRERDASRPEVAITAIGHADLLRQIRTPVNWQGWSHRDLADVLRDLVLPFRFRRWTTQADWQSAVAMANVDLTTEPGKVLLAREPYLGAQRFKASGYIVLRAQLSGALPTGRVVRWSEEVGSKVRITVQTRAADSPSALNAAPWGPEMTAVHAEDVRENETIGVPVADGGEWVDLRFNLYTDDTTTPDNEQAPTIYGFTPLLTGVEVIWRTQGPVQPGNIPASSGSTLESVEYSRANALQVLTELCEEHGWQFRVYLAGGQIVLDAGPSLGVDRSGTVVLRHGENAEFTTIRDSDEDLVNVLHCFGAGDGPDQLYVELRDEASIAQYGEYHGDFSDDSLDTLDALMAAGQEELRKRSQPKPAFEVVHPFGVVPPYTVGDTVTAADPRTARAFPAVVEEYELTYEPDRHEVRASLNAAAVSLVGELLRSRRRAAQVLPQPLPPPASVRVVAHNRTAVVMWSEVPGATGYDVERSDDGGATWTTVVSNTAGLAWADVAVAFDRQPLYRVRSRRGSRRSYPSAAASARTKDKPPATPTGLSLSTGVEAVGTTTFAYVLVQFDSNPEPDVSHYRIRWRKNEPGGEWAYHLVFHQGTGREASRIVVPGGHPIAVQVQAVNVGGIASGWSEERVITSATDTAPPSVPSGLTVAPIMGGLLVTLDTPPDPDWDGFEVHVSTEPGFTPSQGTVKARGRATRFVIGGLTPLTQHFVRARAYDLTGNYSPFSEEQSATPSPVSGSELDPQLVADLGYAKTQAAVVEANRSAWDQARAVSDARLLTGTVTSASATTLQDSATNFGELGVLPNYVVRVISGQGVGQLRAITQVNGSTITVDPPWDVVPAPGDAYEIASSARITSREQGSIVATLNRAPGDPAQFSSIRQTAQQLEQTVAMLNSDPDDPGQFSSIRQTAQEIASVVGTLNSPMDHPQQYSAIRQAAQEIDLRVRRDGVIAAINMSPEEIQILAQRLSFVPQLATRSPWRESFEKLPSDWIFVAGDLSRLSLVDDASSTGGKVLRASGYVWLVFPLNIPFDPNATYKISGRVRQVQDPTSGGKAIYIGVEGVAADGSTLVNIQGQNTHSSQHYIAASYDQLVAGSGWVEFTGYFRGWAATGSGKSPSLASPGRLHQNVRYIRPLFILNYAGGDGVADIDHLTLETVQDRAAVGRIVLDPEGLKLLGASNELNVKLDATTGDAWFRGSVEASEFRLPVRSA